MVRERNRQRETQRERERKAEICALVFSRGDHIRQLFTLLSA